MINKQGRPKKEFTEDEKAEILDLYLNTKLSRTEISSKLKVADYRVNNFLEGFHIPQKKRNPPTKKEIHIDVSQIFKLRQQCYSSEEIAKKLNVSDKFLRSTCIQNNINLNISLPKHINVQGKVEEIIEKFKNEISIFELAKEYSVGHVLISKILKYYNIPTKRGLTKKQASKGKQYKHGLSRSKELSI
jgi:DNA invertase Pin-like site-specific DNA recombinase